MAKLVQDASLTSVANAIREKTGDTDQLTFPSGFVSAIEGISTGGGATEPYIKETYDASGNLTNVTIPGYTKIREHAFYYCSSLALTELPSGITSIGGYAFYMCTSLALTALPSGITSIGDDAFYNCPNLALTSLPSGLTAIKNSTFCHCASLALTSLPIGLTKISKDAFCGCAGLTSIIFEGTPTTIDSTAFRNCTNITSIKVPWAEGAVANAPWGATNATITYNYTGEGE